MYDETNWRRSRRSYANGGCAEVANWRTSSRSIGNGECAEVASASAGVLVRDTKQAGQPGRTVLAFTGEAWAAFTAALKDGAA